MIMLINEVIDLKFPADTHKLVKILNEIKFRDLTNWTSYENSFVVFSPSEKNTHYTNSFMQYLLVNYLETKEYIERIASFISPTPQIDFWVDEDYYFRINSTHELFKEYCDTQLNPGQIVQEFANICSAIIKK